MSRDPKWTGIYRHGTGWRARVSRGRGVTPLERHFPMGTEPREMQAWRADVKAGLRLTRKQRATSGTFEFDARKYLKTVTALPTYKTRVKDIERWIAIFGTRRRDSITSAEIRGYRDTWMQQPRGPDLPPYAASTINHWLRALSNVWTVLDGRRAPNPVRDVPEAIEPDARPRGLSPDIAQAIVALITDRGRPLAGKKNDGPSLTRLRLRVLIWTGLTYAQLGRLTRQDVDFDEPSMLVQRRKKGKGAKPRRLPLLPQAVDAFTALDAAGGWGAFSGASVRKSFILAAEKLRKQGVALPHVRPYDVRHGFGATVFKATRSLQAVKDLLQHESLRTTARYTLDAVSDVLAGHMADVASSQENVPPRKPLQKR